jgi:UDP-2,3-diacylglucosamine hydrolase
MAEKIGLIAGSGQFPMLFAASAIDHGLTIYTAAFVNEKEIAIICQ